MKQGDTVFVSATATGLGKDKKAVIDKIENVMGTTFVTVTYTHPDAVSGLGGCFVASHIIETDSREKSLIRLALDFSSSPAFLILMLLPAVIMEKALPRAVCPEACLPAGPIKPLDLLLTADNDLKNRPETFSGKDHAKKRAVKTSCLLGSRTLS